MKIDKLVKRITDTIDRNPSLGLGGWELHVSIVDAVDGGVADCSCSKDYDTAWLRFEKKFLRTATDEAIDKTIMHELLHMVFRDFDRVVEDIMDYLGEPHRSSFSEAHSHELEGVVERIARTLNSTSSLDVVQ